MTFNYPAKPEVAALDHFQLDVKAGETVALVGPSGAGKTTVLQMLLRFYDPQGGIIRLDETDIKTTHPEDFRKHIAFVPQETVLFAGTVAENIRYGRLSATDEESEPPPKPRPHLSSLRTRAKALTPSSASAAFASPAASAQRLAIARAILRDAPVLLLDEATSASTPKASKRSSWRLSI